MRKKESSYVVLRMVIMLITYSLLQRTVQLILVVELPMLTMHLM